MKAVSFLTLSPEALELSCGQLMNLVEQSYEPTLLVGIRRGGLIVAGAMARAARGVPALMPLTCQRKSSTVKRRVPLLARGLSALPPRAANFLRLIELRLAARRGGTSRHVDAGEAEAIAARVAASTGPCRILVIDDAVDTGATLASVIRALRELCPEATIRSAAMTVTVEAPLADPDFALHRGVICRFPWSLDVAR